MTVCATLIVRDEADVIEPVIRHLLWHVDEVIVEDHGSTDGTRELLAELPVTLHLNDDPGFWQERRMNELAHEARELGHAWVLPCDGDEVWEATTNRRVAEFLEKQRADTLLVRAPIYDYHPSAADDQAELDPVKRIQFRTRTAQGSKVACRLRPDLRIARGNHDASYAGLHQAQRLGLLIRHYTFRSEQQFLRKVRNGIDSAATAGIAETWSHWHGMTDDEIVERFRLLYYSAFPDSDPSLIRDPAP